jgi:hypothetical protein
MHVIGNIYIYGSQLNFNESKNPENFLVSFKERKKKFNSQVLQVTGYVNYNQIVLLIL